VRGLEPRRDPVAGRTRSFAKLSHPLIQAYFNEIDRLKKFAGTTTEGVISEAFKDLLKSWSRQKNLQFVAQYQFLSNQKTQIRPDGAILHDLRVPLGYWEQRTSTTISTKRSPRSCGGATLRG
jgi:hypothetical protein